MFDKLVSFFAKAWDWIQAMWDKHDEELEHMVTAILPMVISVAFRPDLAGEEKRKVILDAILDNAEDNTNAIANSMINEAIEIAANRYNIQIGKLTKEMLDAAKDATIKAARDFADDKLDLTGDESDNLGVILNNASLE